MSATEDEAALRLLDGLRAEATRQLLDVRGRAILGTSRRSVFSRAMTNADRAEIRWREANPYMSQLVGKLPVTDEGDES